MKSWSIVFTAFVALFSFMPAHAVPIEVLTIHADYFPGREYAIGLDLDSNHMISQIYFQNANEEKTFFSFSELNQFTPIFSIGGITLVRIRIAEQTTPDSATIEMSYTLNYVRGTHRSLVFQVHYDAASAAYQIIDVRTNQIVHEATAYTRYSVLVPIGISRVETQ